MRTLRFEIGAAVTVAFLSGQAWAQGTWAPLKNAAPFGNKGTVHVLSDGTVLAKTSSGGSDGNGNLWVKLIPDSHGSYVNGTWSNTVAPMFDTRLYFSSQLLRDGRLYVAGGEYGTGGTRGEVYNPLTNTWTRTPTPAYLVSDAVSELLPDGKVFQGFVGGGQKATAIWDPANNTYTPGPASHGSSNEASWIKLADNSILFVAKNTTNSERYIPSQNKWVVDATVPVRLYDPYGSEAGPAFLLPDGRAFFLGSPGTTAIYTPSGNANPGTWAAGPTIPNSQGTPDAAGAMMVDGKILCAVSPLPTSAQHFPTPTSFYEYDYVENAFTRVPAPNGTNTVSIPAYQTIMLDLPDGTVLYGQQGSKNFYVYTPKGAALAEAKPTVAKVTHTGSRCDSGYTVTGTLFNGISEGAAYGDDAQMATNFPIVRLTSGTNVYYARTFNWNSTGVLRGNAPDTAQFTLPAGLPPTTYSLVVTANGVASNPFSFTPSCAVAVEGGVSGSSPPSLGFTASTFGSILNLHFQLGAGNSEEPTSVLQLAGVDGKVVYRETVPSSGTFDRKIDLGRNGKGVYLLVLRNGRHQVSRQLAVQ